MKIKAGLIACGLGAILLSGCAVHGVKTESGSQIDEDKINQIVKNKTKSQDIIRLFGAPTNTSSTTNSEYLIYKNCKVGGVGFAVLGVGHTGTKEKCNTLTVIIDKKSDIVTDYNYKKELE